MSAFRAVSRLRFFVLTAATACAGPASIPANMAPEIDPQRPQETSQEELANLDGLDLHELTVTVQKITKYRMLWGEELGLRAKRVNLLLDRPLRGVEEIFRTYQLLLAQQGFLLVPTRSKGEERPSYRIEPLSYMAKQPLPVTESNARSDTLFTTRVIPVRWVSARDLHAALINMVTMPQAILVVESARALIVTDSESNLRRFEEIVHLMDVPGAAQSIEAIPLHERKAEELLPLLTALVPPPNEGNREKPSGFPRPSEAEGIRMVADRSTNAVLLAGSPSLLAMIRDVIQKLDVKK